MRFRLLMGGMMTLVAATTFAAERPSFLVIMTDDQRYDAMGVVQREQGEEARFPWLNTPNMDRLADQGTRFRNAFFVCSLCAPSRAAFLTGRYNHANGIINNRTPLPDDMTTYASLLRDAGYRTAYVGKWHMGVQRGKRPGFDESASYVGQGRYIDCPFEIDGETTATSGWVDDVATDYAIGFLERQSAPGESPFLLVLGYKTPHGPRTREAVPDRLAHLYADAAAKRAVNADDPPPWRDDPEYLEAVDRFQKSVSEYLRRRGEGAGRVDARRLPGEREKGKGPGDWQEGRGEEGKRAYFQLLNGVDENLGRLLDTLEKTGLSANTVVVFASDNGYFWGEHGLATKRAAYEDSIRMPFVVRMPGQRNGATVDAMTLNIDLAPTILDLAGVSRPASMQGRSLREFLQGRTPGDWRTAFLYEYFREDPFPTPTMFAVRTDSAKLIRYPGHEDWTELYDLLADPHEMTNLVDDPAHADLLSRMRAEFQRQSEQLGLNR
jgi:arylsulfatase A-like enzyme